jgi:hypothetical protein
MDAAPQLVQDAVTSPATAQVLSQLTKQYDLHIDVSGLLEKLTGYMLIGYTSPEEFLRELTAAGIADKDARQIMVDVNQKIFSPLRAKMMGTTSSAPQKPAIPAVAPLPRTQPAPVTTPKAVPDQSGSYFHLENKIPVPQQPKPVMPLPPRPAAGNLPPKAFLPRPNMLGGQKPMPTNRLLEDHEEPSPSLSPAVPTAPTAPVQAAQPKDPSVMPLPPRPAETSGAGAPPNLPGAMPSVNELSRVAIPEAPASTVRGAIVHPPLPAPAALTSVPVPPIEPAPLTQPQAAPSAPVQAKSHDPYREPIDEPAK